MQLFNTQPLAVQTASIGAIEVKPVRMNSPNHDVKTSAWLAFIKKDGLRIPVSRSEAYRVSHYMSEHGTDAVSFDGKTALTVAGNFLLECQPEVFEQSQLCEA